MDSQHNTTLEARIDRIEKNLEAIANTTALLLEEMRKFDNRDNNLNTNFKRKFNNRDNNLNTNFKQLEVNAKRVKLDLTETKEQKELRELTDLIDSNQKIGNKEFKNLGIIVQYSSEKLDPKAVKIPLCETLEAYVKNNKDKSKMILSLGNNGTGKNHSVEQIAKMDNAVLIKIRGSANKEDNERVKRVIDHLSESLANKKNILLLVDEVDPKKNANGELAPKFNVDFMLMNSIYDRYMDPANISDENKIKLTLVMNGNNPRAFDKDQTKNASDTTQKNTFLSRVTRCDFDKPNLANMKKAIPFIVAENIQDKNQQTEVKNYLNKKCDETLNVFIESKIKNVEYLKNAIQFYGDGKDNSYSELDVYINNDESIKKDVGVFKKLLEGRRIYNSLENLYQERINKLDIEINSKALSLQQKLIESVTQNYPIDIRQVKKWLDEHTVSKNISFDGNGLDDGKKK
jgi:hypothetical protein